LTLSYSINYYSSFINQIIILSLLIKLGIPPLHFWLPIISIYIDWIIILILFSIQKIIPFIIISLIINNIIIITIIIILRIIIPPFIIFKINNLKKLISYSSINQIGWILLVIIISPKLWLSYLIIYRLTLIIFVYIISFYSSSNFSSWINLSTPNKLIILSIIINISGLPPFTFFLVKWYRIFIFITSINSYIIILTILFRSFSIIYIYINILIKICLPYLLYSKIYKFSINKNISIWILSLLFISTIIIIF